MNLYNYLLIAVTLSLGFSSYSQCNELSDLEKNQIYSKVKRVTTSGTYIKNDANESTNVRTESYDRKGKELGYIFQHKNSQFQETKTIYTFDEHGNKITELRYDEKGKLDVKLIYKYDSLNNEIESQYYIYQGSNLDSYTHFKYNSNCEMTQYKTYYSDSTVWLSYSFTYENGINVSIIDDYRKTVNKLEYDSFGNCTKNTSYDENMKETSVTTYKYTYDKKNNWLTKTTYTDGKIYWFDEREIKYFLF